MLNKILILVFKYKRYAKFAATNDREFYGIGVVLPGDFKDEDDDFIPFIELVPGGPAEKAGVRAGDKLIQIGQESIKGMKIDTITSKLRGEKESEVTLRVMRENILNH